MTAVTVGFTVPAYNDSPPFHPDEAFPESPGGIAAVSRVPNPAYRLIRTLLRDHGMDASHFGDPAWNPLGELVRPGDTVLLKPNFVLSRHRSGGDLYSIITHPSVLRAIVDYVYIALKGRGRIIIADVPQMDCVWEELIAATQVDSVPAYYREAFGFDVELLDMRAFSLIDPERPALAENRRPGLGDPSGSVIINLGRRSAFYGLADGRYYGADFDRVETNRHHHDAVHEYSVSRTALSADVVISVPKLKVHKKVGVTLNLKGLVGINTNKNYLVHYRVGPPRAGGDQLPDELPGAQRFLRRGVRFVNDHVSARLTPRSDAAVKWLRRVYRLTLRPFLKASPHSLDIDGGNWYGNDSAWRMTRDLTLIFHFADVTGELHTSPQRRTLSIVDGIIGGEGRGPLEPTTHRAGCMIIGEDFLAVDLVATRLMGFDPRRLKQFAIQRHGEHGSDSLEFAKITVRIDGSEIPGDRFFDPGWTARLLGFAPHPGWVGQIECGSSRI